MKEEGWRMRKGRSILGVVYSQQYVGRLEISVNDAARMNSMNGPGQHLDKPSRGTKVLRSSVGHGGKARPLDVLHREIRPALEFIDVIDGDNVWMLQPAKRVGL